MLDPRGQIKPDVTAPFRYVWSLQLHPRIDHLVLVGIAEHLHVRKRADRAPSQLQPSCITSTTCPLAGSSLMSDLICRMLAWSV